MALSLKKGIFARNHEREDEFGSIFSRTSSNLTFIMNLVIAGLYTPVVIATGLISKDVILMLANIFLGLGYFSNFIYRLYQKEVSASELIVTVFFLTLGVSFAFSVFPVISALGVLKVLCYANYAATALNSFFLLRPFIVPPCKKVVECIAGWLGFGNIRGDYFYKKPLALPKDRFVIDLLFTKHYNHDSVSMVQSNEELRPFNRMLLKLSFYINKYRESFFGSLSNSEKISSTEKLIHQLTVEGHSVNCITFISRKISFKTTKIKEIQEAIAEIKAIDETMPLQEVAQRLRFFESYRTEWIKKDRVRLVKTATTCLENEIQRQQDKIESLQACLPSA